MFALAKYPYCSKSSCGRMLLPIYRSPTQDPCYFVDNVCRIIDGYALSRENVLLIGDFNMEVGDRALSPLINTYHLFNLLKGPTCFKTSRGRSIDLILTNKKHSFMKSQSFETGFSDHHHLIYTILKSTFVKLPPRNIRYREYRNFCAEEFQRDLDIKLRDTIPTDYQALHSVTESVLQKHAPLKQRMVRGNNKPHVKSDMRKAIMTRTRLKTRANKSGNDEDRKKYKQQRNLIVSMNRKAKRDFYHSVDINAIDNDKKFWKAVKPMFSNGNPMGEKIVLIEEGEVISDDKVIAECLNSHFVNITDSLGLDPSFKDDGIDVSLENKVDIATEKYNNHPSIVAIKSKVQIEKKFEFNNVNLLNVMIKIEALDNSKSNSGNIPTKIIQEAKEVICPYLTDCINATMDNCCFPDKLKEADVCAIHKKDDTCQKVNYRPISVLSAMSKIFERIMSEQINQFFVGILSSLLSGFRQGYSTQHALFRVVETWKKCLDMSGIVGTILMDLSKAYDCIPHDLLIAKLEAYGFKKNALKLVYSYLTNRTQRVKIGSTYSLPQHISIGVPQGSVLGSLLFNIFINDLFYMELESEICNFADDTTIYACDTDVEAVMIRLENDLQGLMQWFTNNGMSANPSKFQIMFLGLKGAKKLCLNMNGQLIPSSEHVKLLGVNIDNSLKFETHVKEICKKVNQKLYAFGRLRPFLGEQKSKLLLNSVVMSNFSYCPLIWLFCSKAANNEINRTHKRALRTLYRDYESTFEELLDRGDTKTTHKKNLQNLMVEIYKSMNHLNPEYMWDFFVKKMFPTTFGLRNYASSPR